MLSQLLKQFPGAAAIIDLSVRFEDWWFDYIHQTDTGPEFAKHVKQGWWNDPVNFKYIPTRPKCARRLLSCLPLENPCDYTFVDFGSGKGRMLLIAAAFGFKRLVGIELRPEVHATAIQNLRQGRRLDLSRVECLNSNALNFSFPDEKLVLYFFNPFGEDILTSVLTSLGTSLEKCFRDVLVVLEYPVYAEVADRMPHLKLEIAKYNFRIYRSRLVSQASSLAVSASH